MGSRQDSRLPAVELSYLAAVCAQGEDAQNFLNVQFCNDITVLAAGAVQWNAWCNPKGRVISTFLLLRTETAFYIILPRELAEDFLAQLRKYILRAKVDLGLFAGKLMGIEAAAIESTAVLSWCEKYKHIYLHPPTNANRLIVLTREEQGLDALDIANTDRSWRLHDVQYGVPWLQAASSEQFLPQNLNLDWLQGMSFTKGCYPGQEVIARLHYRGSVKQRLLLATVVTTTDTLPSPMQTIYHPAYNRDMGKVLTVLGDTDTVYLLVVMEFPLVADTESENSSDDEDYYWIKDEQHCNLATITLPPYSTSPQ